MKVETFCRMIREMDGFKELIEEIDNQSPRNYKPVRRLDNGSLDPDTQKNNWVFDSGVLFENARILKLLTGEK